MIVSKPTAFALVLGLVSVLVASAAKAECDVQAPEGSTYSEAMVDVLEGAGRGYNCEAIELQDGSFEAQCDEVASPDESRTCSGWAYGFEGLGDDDADGMYEACMVIALHTGAVSGP